MAGDSLGTACSGFDTGGNDPAEPVRPSLPKYISEEAMVIQHGAEILVLSFGTSCSSLTKVPCLLPRSVTQAPSQFHSRSAWRREVMGSLSIRSAVRPISSLPLAGS